MVNIIKQEIEMEIALKNKIEFICSFCNTTPTIHNGSIRTIDHTNISYVEPHRIVIKGITYLAFNYEPNVYVENLSKCIPIKDLEKIVPSFKVANAVVHYDGASPHLHIVGVPVKDGNKNGMKKQVGKSTVFTKESLHEIQDTMRVYCKKSFNKIYQTNIELLEKLEGRNEDISIKNMPKQYNFLKEQADRNRERLEKVNKQTKTTLSKFKEVKEIISNLKPTKITKNNFIINDEEISVINNYIESVDKNISDIKSVNDLTTLMEDFEENLKTHDKEVNELEDKIKKQDQRIKTLEKQNITKQDKIYEQVIDEMLDEDILDNEDIDYIQNSYYEKKDDDFEYNR